MICEHAEKRCYTSKHAARKGLVGGLRGKSIRVYMCEHCHTYHITKEQRNDLRSGKATRRR